MSVYNLVSSCIEGDGSDSSSSTSILSNDEHSNTQSVIEQQVKTTPQSEEQQVSINITCECTKVKEKLPCEQQTGQLVKEVRSCLSVFFASFFCLTKLISDCICLQLEQTQKELSRLQQFNRNLQDELQQERENHSRVHPQVFTIFGNSSHFEDYHIVPTHVLIPT